MCCKSLALIHWVGQWDWRLMVCLVWGRQQRAKTATCPALVSVRRESGMPLNLCRNADVSLTNMGNSNMSVQLSGDRNLLDQL